MAEIVAAAATSHSPQLSISAENWDLLTRKDETDPGLEYAKLLERAKPDIATEITREKWQQRHNASQAAIATLGRVLEQAKPDVIVIFGDDQHEQFFDDNLPTFAIYHGDAFPLFTSKGKLPGWKQAEQAGWAPTARKYPNDTGLAEYLIGWLSDHEFDIARSNRIREGIGHAFSFLYRRLLPGAHVPLVPIMVNTYYPPNQPTPKRCHALGQSMRKAIEAWDSAKRVALIASGGLSHFVIDEELDRTVLEALVHKDTATLCSLPRHKLKSGTSETLNWIALGGAVEPMAMTLVDYVPSYRSPAGTGCAMGFAYWT